MMNISGKLPCRIYGYVRVISIYFHSQMCRCIRHQNSDRSQTDHSYFFSFQLRSCKSFLLLFCDFCDISVFFVLLHPVDTSDNVTGCQKHSCNYEFFHTICIGSGCIEYYDPFLRTTIQRNIVHTCTCSCHNFQVLRQFHLMHRCTSDQNCVCRLCSLCFLIVLCKFIESNLRDWIQAMILIHTTHFPPQTSS